MLKTRSPANLKLFSVQRFGLRPGIPVHESSAVDVQSPRRPDKPASSVSRVHANVLVRPRAATIPPQRARYRAPLLQTLTGDPLARPVRRAPPANGANVFGCRQ